MTASHPTEPFPTGIANGSCGAFPYLRGRRQRATALGRLPRFDSGSANGRYRRILLLAAHTGEGRFTKPTAAVQTWWSELVLMPISGH